MTPYLRRVWFASLAIFLVTLLISFPADRALYLLRGKLPAGTDWQQVSGPVLHPVFYNLIIRLSDNRSLSLESAEARIALLPLLLGRLKLTFNLRPAEGEISGVLILKRQGWQLPQIEGSAQVKMLAMFLPELSLAGANGHVVFSGEALTGEYLKLPVTGRFEADIRELQLDMLNTQRPLGDYSIKFQTVNQVVEGKLETVSADAQLSIQGQLSLDPLTSTMRFAGQAWAAATAPDSVQSLLPLLGPVEQGRSRIQWQGKL